MVVAVHDICFAIDESKITPTVPTAEEKTQAFSALVPGRRDTYVYQTEPEYYAQYRKSYYALTFRKSGWDCMRHYEIIAAGCMPFFTDIDDLPKETMQTFPRELVKRAMALRGVDGSAMTIDWALFDKKAYFELLGQLLAYAREHLTCAAMARSFLRKCGWNDLPGARVIFLNDNAFVDYQTDALLIGLKRLLGPDCIDLSGSAFVYDDFPESWTGALYGRGFSCTRILPASLKTDQETVRHYRATMAQPKPSLVVYGHVHRSAPFIKEVRKSGMRTAFVCGEDIHECNLWKDLHQFAQFAHLFVRELGNAGEGTLALYAKPNSITGNSSPRDVSVLGWVLLVAFCLLVATVVAIMISSCSLKSV